MKLISVEKICLNHQIKKREKERHVRSDRKEELRQKDTKGQKEEFRERDIKEIKVRVQCHPQGFQCQIKRIGLCSHQISIK